MEMQQCSEIFHLLGTSITFMSSKDHQLSLANSTIVGKYSFPHGVVEMLNIEPWWI